MILKGIIFKKRIDQRLVCVLRNFIPGRVFPIVGGGSLKNHPMLSRKISCEVSGEAYYIYNNKSCQNALKNHYGVYYELSSIKRDRTKSW